MLGKIKCFLIKNDKLGLQSIKNILKDFTDVEVCGYATNKIEAIKGIQASNIDLILADTELQDTTSFEILKELRNVAQIEIIFISTHKNYALEAIKFNAIDYLIEPIKINQLRNAINLFKENQYLEFFKLKKLISQLKSEKINKRIAISHKQHVEFVEIDKIIYIKADINYSYVYLQNSKTTLTSKTLKEFNMLLKINSDFFRIHQSYLININHVNKVLKTKLPQVIMSNGDTLNVSRSKKSGFLKKISLNY